MALMKRWELIALALVLAVDATYAQKVRPVFQDSLDVIVGTPITVKDRLRSWSSSFGNLRYQVALFRDPNFQDQLSTSTWDRDRSYQSDPGAYNIRIVDTLPTAGKFYLPPCRPRTG